MHKAIYPHSPPGNQMQFNTCAYTVHLMLIKLITVQRYCGK